jgi:ABC-type polysaccharide/polyol phosphate transport system ATPase subunit
MMNENNKIVGIDDIDIITNGTIEELGRVSNPNQIGTVLSEDGTVISNITPLIMIINQGAKDYKKRVDKLVEIGSHLDMDVNYYNSNTTARDLSNKYRNGVN